jgi:Ca2+:H+ antiporter
MMMRWLLLVVPVALTLRFFEAKPLLVFATSLLAIVPLVELMGSATERLAHRLGSVIGGLINTTLSNAPELIIGVVALHNGLGRVVKASLTGSILVNLLVGLGCERRGLCWSCVAFALSCRQSFGSARQRAPGTYRWNFR